jgi:hypothetical protein
VITEWLLSFAEAIGDWFIGLFPDEEPPSWITGVSDYIADLFQNASGLGAWVPFVLLGTVASAVFGLWLVLWLIKLVRWVWGLTPFSGGS